MRMMNHDQNEKLDPELAANLLVAIMKYEFNVEIDPKELARVVRDRWHRISMLAHAIHDPHLMLSQQTIVHEMARNTDD